MAELLRLSGRRTYFKEPDSGPVDAVPPAPAEAPEAVAVGRMVDGLRALHAEDASLLEHGIGMFDALARAVAAGHGGTVRYERKDDRTRFTLTIADQPKE